MLVTCFCCHPYSILVGTEFVACCCRQAVPDSVAVKQMKREAVVRGKFRDQCSRSLCTCGPPYSRRCPTSRFPFRAARSHDWPLWSQTEADKYKGLPVFRVVFFKVDWGGGHGRPSRCCRPLCTCGPPHSTLKRRPTARFPFRAARSHDWLLWSQTKRPTRVYRC